ncbi:MAG: hypothetical protein AVDCRST_MAG78-1388 [uncultured Rubrobacteraceae bacterium]|uniref:FAD linked oxidase N-terminal domain-containing protein n=1 Tax=uncultured Rubrobacteraceae bacterium TaxID=349277 RepID=A0A6J4PWP3_9ACTN|nr:MAG: hypothetical protein AVDCRST_MAG78-1388 [uncultured Rubrobacteraceae bacterium]
MRGTQSPLRGGISLDLGFMNRILEFLPEDSVARAELGVTYGQLNARLGKHGLSPGGSRV